MKSIVQRQSQTVLAQLSYKSVYEDLVMVYLQNNKSRVFVTSFAPLLVLALFFDAIGTTDAQGQGVGCLPPTPCPCSADGICRPNQASFGYSPTRWRPWPGDPKIEEPTPADEQAVEEEMELEPFERPAPEEEDTRGPAKTKSFSPAEADASPAITEEVPFPELDQQGSIPVEIRQDDAPPELPRRLRRLESASRLGHLSMTQTSQIAQSGNYQPRQRLSKRSKHGSAIMQVTTEQRVRMKSKRPASLDAARSTATEPAETGLEHRNQQAIYYQTVNRSDLRRAK